MWPLDELALELLAPLAVWVFLSGLDDALLDLGSLRLRLRSRPGALPPAPHSEVPRIALIVPCWREADVIGRMLRRNLEHIRYSRFDVWVGLYPNDPDSLEAVRQVAAEDSRVRWVVGRADGPTTKADNMNEILRGILDHERGCADYYELFLQHDAEDVIHPESLTAAAALSQQYDFIQFPVFPLAKPLSDWTHGVYCDEFAEAHLRDLPVRSWAGGFIPSAGVGTAMRREAVDRLRILNGDAIFDPRSLTEDYFLGLQTWRLGLWQRFSDADVRLGEPVATRAFFPDRFGAAVRQRSRWIIGNCLQAWERFGWTGSVRQAYWLWRDRKGLVGHPVSILANLLFLYGLAGAASGALGGGEWRLGTEISSRVWLLWLLGANLFLLVWRQAVRVSLTARIYGPAMGATAPLRSLWSNVINVAATGRALAIWARARFLGGPLTWAKTAHVFPDAEGLEPAGSETGKAKAAGAGRRL